MSEDFDSLRARFEEEVSKSPQRKNPRRSWVPTPFTQISITESQTKSIDINNTPSLSINSLNIGDTVQLKNGTIGQVKYIGNIHVKKGIWIGLELDEANGNHDGKIKGKRYFQTQPNHATFVKYKKIKTVISTPNQNEESESEDINEMEVKSEYIQNTESADATNPDQNTQINIQSPPSIPEIPYTPNTPHTPHTAHTPPVIDLDEHSGDFDIAAFEIIKKRLQKCLQQQCYDVLAVSTKYDTRLNDERRYNKTLNRLQIYIEALIVYTTNILNNHQYMNQCDVAVLLGPPFNVLPEAILNIDMLKYGHLCWDITLKYISILSFLDEVVWIPLQYIAMILPSSIGIRLLFEMPHKFHLFPPLHINRICKRVAEGSQHPIAICLRIAQFMKVVSRKSIGHLNEYQTLYDFYTKIGIDIIKGINSDHAALIVLECPTDLEPSSQPPLDCLQIAIQTENAVFLTNKRVMAILDGIWLSYGFLEGAYLTSANNFSDDNRNINFLNLLHEHYRCIPAMPIGKYMIQLLLFIIEVALLSWFAIRRLSISSSFEYYEITLWSFGLSAAAEAVYKTINNDRMFKMNIADISALILGINFGALFVMRFYFLMSKPSNSEQQSSEYLDADVTFDTLYAFTLILAFLRISTLFAISKRFGVLLIIVEKMTNDIRNFAFLWILFVMGFIFAQYFYISQQIGFSFSDTLIEIFAVTTGFDANFETYSSSANVSRSRSIVAQISLVMLILFGTLLLINLFIAMMARTFDILSDKTNETWSLNASRFIITYDRTNDILPPPFNLVVYVIVCIWYLFEIPLILINAIQPIAMLDLSLKDISLSNKISSLIYGHRDIWLCTYCHCVQICESSYNANNDTSHEMKKWMNRVGMDTRDRANVMETHAKLCKYCKRVQRNLKRYEWIGDKVSYYIAYFIILPIIMLLSIPTGFIKLVFQKIVNVETNNQHEFYILLREKQRIEIGDDNRMKKIFAQKRISQLLLDKQD